MLDVLAAEGEDPDGKRQGPGRGLLTSRACPGFLVPPEEQAEVQNLLTRLLRQPVGSTSLGELLGRGLEGP
jgi:hypothetical protein